MTRAGMTLAETLVTLVLLGLTMTLGLAALGLVGRAGPRVAADATEVLTVQDFIRLRLLAAQPLVTEGPAGRPALLFEGAPGRLVFAAELPARFGVPGPARIELRQDGDALGLGWAPLGTAEAGGERTLLAGVSEFRLAYFGAPRANEEPGWRDRWEESARLPDAIAIHLAFAAPEARHWPSLVVAPRLARASRAVAP